MYSSGLVDGKKVSTSRGKLIRKKGNAVQDWLPSFPLFGLLRKRTRETFEKTELYSSRAGMSS